MAGSVAFCIKLVLTVGEFKLDFKLKKKENKWVPQKRKDKVYKLKYNLQYI